MKFFYLFILLIAVGHSQAQTIEELEAQKAELEQAKSGLQEQVDTYNGYQSEINAIDESIKKLIGWQTGFSGIIGFDFNKSNNWVSNPNPDASSSSLNIGLNFSANKITDDDFWRNKAILNKSWSDVDISSADGTQEDDGLFDNGTLDILNLSSLYGRSLSDKFAISALGELNSSLGNFLDPGTFDIGVGGTWNPSPELVIVFHPLNYHFAFSGIDGLESTGLLGTKIRADYSHTFGEGVNFSSTFTTFIPYAEKTPSLSEYTWLNTISFDIWKGIGVGVSLGLRKSDFESSDTQSYYSFGLSYSL